LAAAWSERGAVKLTKQKNFRLSDREAELLRRAVRKAGVTESLWLRLVVLAALGETELGEQLQRASKQTRVAKRSRQ
jgi:hypothetical protein